jgi:hypothetical protein
MQRCILFGIAEIDLIIDFHDRVEYCQVAAGGCKMDDVSISLKGTLGYEKKDIKRDE